MRDNGKARKEKLYAKYHNVLRNLKIFGLIESIKKNKLSSSPTDFQQMKNLPSNNYICC